MSVVISEWNEISGAIGHQLAWASAVGGIAMLAAIGLARSAFLPARVNCWFLRLSLVKLLIAALFVAPLSIPLLSPDPQRDIGEDVLSIVGTTNFPTSQYVELEVGNEPTVPAEIRLALSPVVMSRPKEVDKDMGWSSIAAWTWISMLWLIGVVIQTVVYIHRFFRTVDLRRKARHVSSSAVETALDRLSRSMRVRRPDVLIHEEIASPCLIGIQRPCVLVADALTAENRSGVLRDVLAHELAHVVRRDLLWNLLPVTASCIFYFHPLLWLLRREMAVQTEIATDQIAITASGSSPRQYANSLLGLIAIPTRRQEFRLGYGVTFRGLRRRLDTIFRGADESSCRNWTARLVLIGLALTCIVPWRLTDGADSQFSVATESASDVMREGGDWPQWGGTHRRNNVSAATNLAHNWDVGRHNRETGEWDKRLAKNVGWVANLGTQSFGSPVVADGRVFVGTNNGAGYLKRYPSAIDLGCLLAFDERSGDFLWQHSSEKLKTGRVHDWPLIGICSTPLVEGDRLWFVTSRGEVRCLDTAGFHDGEDDGAVQDEEVLVTRINGGPSAEAFAATLAGLRSGTLSQQAKRQLHQAGEPLQGELVIETVQEDRVWNAVGNFSGVDREITIKQIGSRIEFTKRLGVSDRRDADVVWIHNMMGSELRISQRNMCSCSVTSYGDLLFVNTGIGIDHSATDLAATVGPSFVCMDKNTGTVLWTDASPGANILNGQWSSPAVGVFEGVPQVLFAGGDGVIYSFAADRGIGGSPQLLWMFDCNPKKSKWILGSKGTRNSLIAMPVVSDGRVYVSVGQDPEHGEGDGHLWCIDPTRRGDISPTLAMKIQDGKHVPIPRKRIQAVDENVGEIEIQNPNSGAVWHYSLNDANGDGRIGFEERMHRTISNCVVKDGVLYVADFSGLFHCLDASGADNGEAIVHYTYDMLAQNWGSPLIADGHVFVGDEDGDIAVFAFGPLESEPVVEINMKSSVYSTPVAANQTIFIATKEKLFAIRQTAADVGQ